MEGTGPACPRPGPWFGSFSPALEVGTQAWDELPPFSKCDSGACTLCQKPQLHEAGQARQRGPGLLQGFFGKVGRAMSKHGRPQHPQVLDDGPRASRACQLELPRDTLRGDLGAQQSPGLSSDSCDTTLGRKRPALDFASEGHAGSQALSGGAPDKSHSYLETTTEAISQAHHAVPMAVNRTSMDNSAHEMVFPKRARIIGRLSVEGVRSSFDVRRSSTEARRQSMDGRPSMDGRRSSLDRGRPSIDGRRMSLERPRPSLDAGRCPLDRGRSFDRSRGTIDRLAGCEPLFQRCSKPEDAGDQDYGSRLVVCDVHSWHSSGWHALPHLSQTAAAAHFTPLGTARPDISADRNRKASIVSGMDFSPDGQLLVCVSLGQEMRVYPVGELASQRSGGGSQLAIPPITTHQLPHRIGAVSCNPWEEGVVVAGCWNGAVMQVNVVNGHWHGEEEEHSRRVWSVAHSPLSRNLVASTSDDGTARLWAGQHLSQSMGVISPGSGAPVTCADFSHLDENALALASCDNQAYLYDLRRLDRPVKVIDGHQGPVAYVKFMGHQRIITSSIDETISCWDLDPLAASPFISHPTTRFTGHVNRKRFVGLSVLPEMGLVASGSEDSHLFTYHMSKPGPLATLDLDDMPGMTGEWSVNSVCWQPCNFYSAGESENGPVLAAALTSGNVLLLRLDGAETVPRWA